jgi:two-component system sensor histidine kinase HydH
MPAVGRVTRWTAIVAVVLMGAALALTAWTTYTSVADASVTLLVGQADALAQTLRSELGPGPQSSDDLAAFVDDQAATGLRYVAILDGAGRIEAQGGTASTARPTARLADGFARDLVQIGDRVRLEMRLPQRRALRALGRPAHVVLEFEPLMTESLRAAARRSLGIGALAASTLLAVAVGLVRWILLREARARQREHERRLAGLGEMSAVLAHEIKNPLASLKGNAQLLAEQLPAGERPRQKADRVVAEAVRLESLVHDLLGFVRTGELQRAPVDPGALVAEVAAAVDPAITVDAAGAPPSFALDPGRMRQVLANLLDNAVHAGGPVRAKVAGAGGRLVVEVTDHGPGVPAANRDRVFEPFFTTGTHGTGLGLAVARRIVELHAGTLTVDDADGGGARFRVDIPEA